MHSLFLYLHALFQCVIHHLVTCMRHVDFLILPCAGLEFDSDSPDSRDHFFHGDCDKGVRQLARLLGWEEELDALVKQGPIPAAKASAAAAAVN